MISSEFCFVTLEAIILRLYLVYAKMQHVPKRMLNDRIIITFWEPEHFAKGGYFVRFWGFLFLFLDNPDSDERASTEIIAISLYSLSYKDLTALSLRACFELASLGVLRLFLTQVLGLEACRASLSVASHHQSPSLPVHVLCTVQGFIGLTASRGLCRILTHLALPFCELLQGLQVCLVPFALHTFILLNIVSWISLEDPELLRSSVKASQVLVMHLA